MLLIDRLKDQLSEVRHPTVGQHLFSASLENVVVFEIDNVARYFYEDDQREDWPMESFPNLAPPFENMWLEFRTPAFINSNGAITNGAFGRVKQVGAFIYSHRIEEGTGGWLMCCECYMRGAHGDIHEYGKREMFALNKDGSFNPDYFGDGKEHAVLFQSREAFERLKAVGADNSFAELLPAFLAMSFLHCKNVEMVPSQHLAPQRKRDRGAPDVRYYTIRIDPMKKVLRTEGNSQTSGIRQALHICRGHFKDYSKGDGLFGKYKGLYWWESQVRGAASQGTVVKDYSVTSPINASADLSEKAKTSSTATH